MASAIWCSRGGGSFLGAGAKGPPKMLVTSAIYPSRLKIVDDLLDCGVPSFAPGRDPVKGIDVDLRPARNFSQIQEAED
jgi:hypothetical protein